MTKNNYPTEIIPAEIIYADTGEVDSMEKRLFFLEQQLAYNTAQIALTLKEIRDFQLYRCRKYTSMQEYVDECIPISIATVKRFLQVADNLKESTLVKLENTPMKYLLEIARNEELRDEANNTDDPSDIVKKAKELERKKYQKKLTEYEDTIKGKETLLVKERDKVKYQNEKIDDLKKTINEMASREGIDPDRLIYITKKREAIECIQEMLTTNLRLFSNVTSISQELMDDPETTGMLVNALSAIKAGIGRIESTYFMQIKTANNIDVIPE